MIYTKTHLYLCLSATLLAYCVIVLGAYTRLSDAGLGCPDWPGCYGEMIVPEDIAVIEQANAAYPDRPLEQSKAWKEMIHRYAAGALGLLILFLAVNAWLKWLKEKQGPVVASTALLLLVIFQAALGMWTVTLLLKPVIVTAHLLGGMAILALLFWLLINTWRPLSGSKSTRLTPWAVAGLVVVYSQIALGGWTSANYSALICTDFPTCQAQWWPQMNFSEGFRLWRGLGIDYEGGVLDAAARTAIHVSHRIGALVTLLIIGSIAIGAIITKKRSLVLSGAAVLLVLSTQLSLGVANILMVLPLPVAVAHNGVAALLLLSLLILLYFSFSSSEAGEQ